MAEPSNPRRERAEQMRKERERTEKRRRNLITAAVVVVVLIVIAGAGLAVKTAMDDVAADPVRSPKGLTEGNGIVLTAEDFGGTAKADPVKVTVFEDLQCPVCKVFEEATGSWFDEQTESGEIEVEYRPVAFLTEFSAEALAASMCVFEEEGAMGWREYVKTVFANQPEESGPGVDNSELVDWAESAGVDSATECIEGRPFREWAGEPPNDYGEATQEAFESTDSDGQQVTGTPTVWVDGKVVTGEGGGTPGVAELQAAVEAAKAN